MLAGSARPGEQPDADPEGGQCHHRHEKPPGEPRRARHAPDHEVVQVAVGLLRAHGADLSGTHEGQEHRGHQEDDTEVGLRTRPGYAEARDGLRHGRRRRERLAP